MRSKRFGCFLLFVGFIIFWILSLIISPPRHRKIKTYQDEVEEEAKRRIEQEDNAFRDQQAREEELFRQMLREAEIRKKMKELRHEDY